DYHVPVTLSDTIRINKTNPAESVIRTGKGLEFVTSEGIHMQPLYDTHRCRYVVYWNITE
ncbi:MAG: hypothetical protein K2M76_07560, partial [Muribaculaceae bacterium]|nr:hypothetical protein [Muribaculaceae bacterium]